jgi:hypothetical protein
MILRYTNCNEERAPDQSESTAPLSLFHPCTFTHILTPVQTQHPVCHFAHTLATGASSEGVNRDDGGYAIQFLSQAALRPGWVSMKR